MKASIIISAACMLALSAAAPVFEKRSDAFYVPPSVDGKEAQKRDPGNSFYGKEAEKRDPNPFYGKEAEKRDPSNSFYVPPSVDGKEAVEVL
ncbi:hypothetical protein M409DRAFT_25424 [Zasmidium cellare ATCC 36951]|uniref:Uncharacterized protein n=1 Tax=Zasmidium cellare ATCC 36951 TaxID=1080233 RepID=A0A6A6CF95_ZASCE|nr:uncharacterized protein M409DRAFT_25424 [Zasmidium cellare ATCC 36951]KAF2164076.1 hypothetical protein M409DRAFT_25424 [Zasmidium cellare ATCC 36951]